MSFHAISYTRINTEGDIVSEAGVHIIRYQRSWGDLGGWLALVRDTLIITNQRTRHVFF